MPLDGVHGFLDVESAALRAPQVGIANSAPQHILSVGSNLYVSGDSSDVLTVDGNVVCEGVKVGLIEIIPSYDLEAVANVGNSTSNTIQFTNPGTGIVTTGNVTVGKELNVTGNVQIRGTTFIKANRGTGDIAIGTNAGLTSQGDSAVAMGRESGQTTQGFSSVAVGVNAGQTTQGGSAVAVGRQAGQTSQAASTVAMGYLAGNSGQGFSSVAVGAEAGKTTQGLSSVAVGRQAGQTSQANNTVAIGIQAGQTTQGIYAVAMGRQAGNTSQGQNAVAVGREAGQTTQGLSSVAVGYLAGNSSQGQDAVAVGRGAGQTTQGLSSVAVGYLAGQSNQGPYAIAIGADAGATSQADSATAVGYLAGQSNQELYGTAVGRDAGRFNQGSRATAVGVQAGSTSQGENAVAVGRLAGYTSQGDNAIAMGAEAGKTSQGSYAVAVGYQAGQTSQGNYATALGWSAGNTSQELYATAVGYQAGFTSQGNNAVAVGREAGETSQSENSVAVGYLAGNSGQGDNAVAVGRGAGQVSQGANSIILNATGEAFNSTTTSSFHVKPVRGGNFAASALAYTADGEIVEETGTHFDASGNVGIGTTNPLNILHLSSDISTLDASGSATFDEYSLIIHNTRTSGSNGTELGLCFNHYDSAYPAATGTPGAAITHERTNAWSQGKLHFKTKSENNETGTCDTRMTIDEGGNVGIGITNPQKLLHIKQGEGVSQGPGNAIRIQQQSGGEYFDIGMDNDQEGADLYFQHSSGIEFIMGGDNDGYFLCPELQTNSIVIPDMLNSNPTTFAGGAARLLETAGTNGGISQISNRGGLAFGSGDDRLLLGSGDNWWKYNSADHNVELEVLTLASDNLIEIRAELQNDNTVWSTEYQYFTKYHHYLDGRGTGSTASHFTVYRQHGGSLYKVGYDGGLQLHSDNLVDMIESDEDVVVFRFDVNSDIMYLNGNEVIPSDDRLKINETRISDATRTLLKLDPQLYDKKRFLHSNIVTHEAGFITQDVWYTVPEIRYLVHLSEDAEPAIERPYIPDDIQDDPNWEEAGWGKKTSSFNYQGMIPFIVKSIQEIVTELPTEKTQVLSEGDVSGRIVSATTDTFTADDKPILTLSNVYCDKTCFGVVSAVKPASRLDSETLVNTNGSGRVWVLDTGTPLVSGDYITTSNIIPGYGQIQSDDITRNYTVAKLTQSCDFTEKLRPKRIIKQKLSDVNYYVKTNIIDVTEEEYNTLDEDKRTTEEKVYYEYRAEERVESDQPYDYVKISPEITMEKYETLSDTEKTKYKLKYFKYVIEEDLEEPPSPIISERKTRTLYKRIVRQCYKTPARYRELEVRQELVNDLDEHGQLHWEDHPTETEKVYKMRYLDADGNITDEANHVYKAAFVGCTYHCG